VLYKTWEKRAGKFRRNVTEDIPPDGSQKAAISDKFIGLASA